MTVLFDYPAKARFDRPVAKSKIYQHTKTSNKQKDLFVQQIEQINWHYKLAAETINIPAGERVQEIQVFQVSLRTAQLDVELLRLIDKAIPHPILFELVHDGRIRFMALHKRPSESNSSKWVLGKQYFGSDWEEIDSPRLPLPVALNLDTLYDKLLKPLLPVKAVAQEDLLSQLERAEKIQTQQRQVDKLQKSLQREKQFNKKVELNQRLRTAKVTLEELQQPQDALTT